MSRLRQTALACTLAAGLLIGWEGKSNKAYLDVVQVPTICYGETKHVRMGDVKTDTECTQLLWKEIHRIDAVISRTVRVDIPDHTRAAFISFIYNVGDGAFLASDAYRRLNRSDIQGACDALTRRDYSTGRCRGYGCGWADGKMIKGLQNRRADERLMCLGKHNDKN